MAGTVIGAEDTALRQIPVFFVSHLFRFYHSKEIIKSWTTQKNLTFLCICDTE